MFDGCLVQIVDESSSFSTNLLPISPRLGSVPDTLSPLTAAFVLSICFMIEVILLASEASGASGRGHLHDDNMYSYYLLITVSSVSMIVMMNNVTDFIVSRNRE